MKRALILLLAVVLMLMCGCAKKTEEAPQTEPTPAPTEPTPAPTEPPTQPPTEPEEPELINPLTGEPVEALTTNRPYAVAINNSYGAMPQHGVAQADILYETLIEGETRCLGIFYDMASQTEPIGTIRSARRDFIRVAMAYDAIFVHKGLSPKQGTQYDKYSAQVTFEQTGWDHVDGNNEAYRYFYIGRTEGYAAEHRTFVNPDKVMEAAKALGCTMTREQSLDVGLQFDEEAFFVGESAKKITAYFNLSSSYDNKWTKFTRLTYNEDTGLYEASQKHGGYSSVGAYVDGNTGESLSFRNVLILHTPIETLKNKNGWMKIDVTGEGEGYFACNGQMTKIKWSRASESDPYTYTLENGTPITLGVGKTYIAIIPMTGHVSVE
ncbi:MAG: DUF3048 domain-containing protein [Oscillospiraceae bacterium]|nr:DUF3048 domain-containing protein [Oscillospiraceae bacterium]